MPARLQDPRARAFATELLGSRDLLTLKPDKLFLALEVVRLSFEHSDQRLTRHWFAAKLYSGETRVNQACLATFGIAVAEVNRRCRLHLAHLALTRGEGLSVGTVMSRHAFTCRRTFAELYKAQHGVLPSDANDAKQLSLDTERF